MIVLSSILLILNKIKVGTLIAILDPLGNIYRIFYRVLEATWDLICYIWVHKVCLRRSVN